MSPQKLLFLTVLGFLIGVWLSYQFVFNLVLVTSSVLFVVTFLLKYLTGRKFLLLFLLTGIIFGALRYEFKYDTISDDYNFSEVNTGVVVNEPDKRETHTKLVVNVDGVKVLVIANHYPEFNYGDTISIDGEITPVENFTSDFDYKEYLSKDEIYFQSYRPTLEKTHIKSTGLGSILFSVKSFFIEKLNQRIKEPESSLLAGLLLGAKESLGDELLDKFRVVGLIHIVVLSGYNVMIVAAFIMYLLKPLPKNISILSGIIAIILFAILTGSGAPTVRASIMAIIGLIARKYGREYSAVNALMVAVLLMVFINPRSLVLDAGFQLSVLATLGLIYVAPILDKFLSFIPEKFGVRELVVLTASAQIAVTPWILYIIGQVSLVSLPVNLVVIPVIPITMLLGFITFFIAIPFAWVSQILLSYIIWITIIFSDIPFASLEIDDVSLWVALFSYGALIALCYYFKQHVVDTPTAKIIKDKNFKHD